MTMSEEMGSQYNYVIRYLQITLTVLSSSIHLALFICHSDNVARSQCACKIKLPLLHLSFGFSIQHRYPWSVLACYKIVSRVYTLSNST